MSRSAAPAPGHGVAAALAAAAEIGADPEGGVSRFAWTPELAQVTERVAGELRELALDVEIDAAGNLIGKWDGPATGAVMAASHLDTVPRGGRFDGALGVLAAVEAVRQLRAADFHPSRPIWIGSFMDEEGTRFGASLFGSRAFCGEDLSAALDTRDPDGITLGDAMAAQGRPPEGIARASQVDQVDRYLELHIEQGPVLWSSGARVAVVEAICGVVGIKVELRGESNHAGTTPMDMRRDALVAAAEIVLALRAQAADGDELRATVGRVAVQPGGRNVIPGRCEFTVDLRPRDQRAFDGLDAWLRKLVDDVIAGSGVEASIETEYALAPTAMDPDTVDVVEQAAADEGVKPVRMASGAGHDAMVVGRHTRAAMLFVPSRDGISHSPEEWTDDDDCELGARVLAGALRRLSSA
jgi:allantoate deiminase